MKSNRFTALCLLFLSATPSSLCAATLNEGFGPLVLVKGEPPVPGGCGRQVQLCSCGHTMKAGTEPGTAVEAGDAVADPIARLVDADPNASPTLLAVTNQGAAAYLINGASNPVLTLLRGETYTFGLNASGHPFFIKTLQGTGTGNAYNSGVTGNGTQVGTVTFTVPMDAPDTLYYNCSLHPFMTARIDVVPEPSTLAALAALAALGLIAGVIRRRGRSSRPMGLNGLALCSQGRRDANVNYLSELSVAGKRL